MKTLLVHPQFSKIGGAEKVALKIIELLISEFNADLTILTNTEFDIQKIKSQTGIALNPKKIRVETVSLPSMLSNKFFHTRMAILHRKAKKIAPNFRLLISTYNELDFGAVALQYVHHPMLASDEILSNNFLASRRNFALSLISKIYRKANNLIAYRNLSAISKNVTATNSHFINDIYAKIYTGRSKVVYPSIIDELDYSISKLNKKKQVLNISRFSPKKNVHSLIEVFDQIHELNPSFGFVIAGHIEDKNYFDSIKKEALKRTYDIKLVTDCSRKEIIELYKKSEYYINPKKYEHFGIAVLEAIKFGCIPFIHASGGSLELVPNHELQFEEFDELSAKLAVIENSSTMKEEIKESLQKHSLIFTENKFNQEIRELIQYYYNHVNN